MNQVATIDQLCQKIDRIVESSVPITTNQSTNFSDALALAKNVDSMRQIFETEEIKDTVNRMKDTPLGFVTDRSPAVIASSRKDLQPYDYNTIKEACIEAMLNGYRITNNEFNIISGRFYPAKNGKYRKIIDHPEVTNFQFTTTSPKFETEQRMNYGKAETVQFAKVQCFASWRQGGQLIELGKAGSANGQGEDTCIFKIKVNNMMGDDAIVGKALSKLFTRVLMRITGTIIPEATDADNHAPDLDELKTANPSNLSERLLNSEPEAQEAAPEPTPDTEPEPEKPKVEFASDSQVKKLNTLLSKLNLKSRELKMQAINVYLEAQGLLPVESSADISKSVISGMIDKFEADAESFGE